MAGILRMALAYVLLNALGVAAGGLQNVTSMFTFLVDQYLQPTGVPVAKLLETPPLGQHSMWAYCRGLPLYLTELPCDS